MDASPVSKLIVVSYAELLDGSNWRLNALPFNRCFKTLNFMFNNSCTRSHVLMLFMALFRIVFTAKAAPDYQTKLNILWNWKATTIQFNDYWEYKSKWRHKTRHKTTHKQTYGQTHHATQLLKLLENERVWISPTVAGKTVNFCLRGCVILWFLV